MKRCFDFLVSLISLILLGFPLLLLIAISAVVTKSSGIFKQERIGQFGKSFKIYKIQTLHEQTKKIAPFSQFLRDSKLDELPQLLNIVLGDMSLVGPRPDIPGYYDQLNGESRKLLELKPGLTSEASIYFREEEKLLNQQENPSDFNDNVIFPQKVKMNMEYYYKRTFLLDLKIILKTIFPK